ncbi:alpha/beta fold hydrolase [Sinimarinibacterium thermocellulolyticum]|uniref:Alpha/beta hydrolase n=1 Tax=Sinimarinibacterium thermocellulolyticum TaxID=3170016 RepID=A0ABV2A5V9_9GAMM
MNTPPAADFLQATTAWQSNAGAGPTLRGRRLDNGRALIHFLHGNGFCGGVYWPFLRHLTGDYDLFCHDLEGHGASDAPARYSGTAAIIKRVPQIIDEQCAQAAWMIGVGHSFGAAVTLAVAARRPDLFRVLVLLDPILLPTPSWLGVKLASRLGRNPMANAARRRRERWASRDEALARLRGRGIYAGWCEEALASFVDHATRDDGDGRVLCCPRELEAAIFENPVYPWRLIRRVRCPVLFLYGESSYPFLPRAARLAARLNRNLTVCAVPGGHCFMQEDPERAATALRRYLADHV